MGADVTSDGYYAIVPEWVLDSGVSGNAVKLYALLRRYADKASGEAHPSRRTLANRMGFQRVASVDPIVAELIGVGAVCTFERWTDHGDRDSNGYHVKSVRPVGVVRSTAPQVVRESGPGVVRETAQQEPQSVEPQSEEPQGAAKRGSRIPESFAITDAMRAYAAEKAPAIKVDDETENFVAYYSTKTGAAAVKINWETVWQTWMRRAQKWAEERGWKPSGAGVLQDATAEMLREQRDAWLRAHDITLAEFEANRHDPEWRARIEGRAA